MLPMTGDRPRPVGGSMTKAELERLALFRYRLRRFLRFSEETTRRHGVTALQYLLLLQIKGFPGREWATVSELAERLQAKHNGVVSLITRCEAAGLVRRTISSDDKRRVEVALTAKGARRVDELARLHRDELVSSRHVLAAGHDGRDRETARRRARSPASATARSATRK
jgi:DNA-binding MarR family transcriptional regulator